MRNKTESKRFGVYVVEQYKDRNGAEKKHYSEIGAAWLRMTEQGEVMSIKLRALPVNGELVCFVAREREESAEPKKGAKR